MPPSTKWLPYLHQSARMGGSLGLGGAGGGAGGDGSLRTGNTPLDSPRPTSSSTLGASSSTGIVCMRVCGVCACLPSDGEPFC